MLLTLRLCLAALFAASACNQTSVTEQLKPLQLLHFSDLHGSALHLQRIVEYMDSHDVDDAIHTGDGVMCYYDDANVFESVPGGRRVLNAIGNHDCWKGHLLWSQTDKPYDATKEEAYSRFFVGPDPRHPTIAEWKVCQPEGVNDVQSPDYQACYYYKDYPCSATRLIVLDCIHYDEAQAAWFTATLFAAREAGLAVIAVTHYPAEFGMVPFDSDLTPDGKDYPSSSNPGAVQVECTTLYTLRAIYAARLTLFAGVDVVLLSLFYAAASALTRLTVWQMLTQFLLPFNVTCCICFGTLYSKRVCSQTLSLLLCILWAAGWSLFVLNDAVFRAISVPAWVTLLAASVLFLGYTLYRGQRNWQRILEVKPLWI